MSPTQRGGIFFSMLEKFSSKLSSRQREREREKERGGHTEEISLDDRGFENNPRDETK